MNPLTHTVDHLATSLSRASARNAWDVERAFDWPAQLDRGRWCMSPELVSLYGTDLWSDLSDEQRHELAFHEAVNFFSVVLQGERPLVQGLAHRLYAKDNDPAVTAYLHHFLEEENRHMAMFGRFCTRYAGKVYPDKKVALAEDYEPGEADVVFFCRVLVVEELGDFYNRRMMRDERIEPIVRELNRAHHVDEARHLVFGRAHLRALFDRWSRQWSRETLDGVREWVRDYVRLSWSAFYNPTMYADAGFHDGYAVRTEALAAKPCMAHRQEASARLVRCLLDIGLLQEAPLS